MKKPLWVRHIPHWTRVVMNRDITRFVDGLPVGRMRALEISGWAHEPRPWQSYRATAYPGFDLCTREPIEPEAEIVFCEQVLEHVPDPVQAVRNIHSLLTPGGWAVISTPFLIRYHPEPGDYWRFTTSGMRILLEQAGFSVHKAADWGNAWVVMANFWQWCPYVPFFQPLWRNPKLPVVVWAFAQKPRAVESS